MTDGCKSIDKNENNEQQPKTPDDTYTVRNTRLF